MTRAGITAPVRLLPAHNFELFDCEITSLNDWRKVRALKSLSNDAARTYVVCIDNTVVGYYCLATGAIALDQAPRPMRRNMPDPIPVIVVGRFAVDRRYQGNGIGSGLLKNAIFQTLQVSDIAGDKAILVHAVSEEAKRYFMDRDFVESPVHPMTLCLPGYTARQALTSY